MYSNKKSTNASRAVFVNEASPDVDYKFGPFDSKSQAISELSGWGMLVPGVEIGVKTGTVTVNGKDYDKVTRYYFKDGIEESNLVELGVTDYATVTGLNNVANSTINYFNNNSVKKIEVRTINNVKSIALLDTNGNVISSMPISDLGISEIVSVLDAPVISVSNNVCTITSNVNGATIYYDINVDPDVEEGLVYDGPFEIDFGDQDSVEIRAIATKDGVNSTITTLVADKVVLVQPPVISQIENCFNITCSTANSVIYYTLDGTTPSIMNGNVYRAGMSLTSSCTIKAVAIVSLMSSSVTSFNFVYTEPVTIPVVESPFVVATWNTGRWSLGKKFDPNIASGSTSSSASYYTNIAAKIKGVLAKIDPSDSLPAVLGVQELNENLNSTPRKIDEYGFDGFENKIHPLGSNKLTYGFYRNAIYTKHMSAIGDGSAVLVHEDIEDSGQGYYTITEATINGKTVALVCTHFDPTATEEGSKNRQAIAKQIQTALENYTYAVIFADFNTREWALMPGNYFNYADAPTEKYRLDCKYPCGFAPAGYSCASGYAKTKLCTDKNDSTDVSDWTFSEIEVNGSGVNYAMVDNILAKGLTISNVGRLIVSKDSSKGYNADDVEDNIALSDHNILYCTLTFPS